MINTNKASCFGFSDLLYLVTPSGSSACDGCFHYGVLMYIGLQGSMPLGHDVTAFLCLPAILAWTSPLCSVSFGHPYAIFGRRCHRKDNWRNWGNPNARPLFWRCAVSVMSTCAFQGASRITRKDIDRVFNLYDRVSLGCPAPSSSPLPLPIKWSSALFLCVTPHCCQSPCIRYIACSRCV